MDSIRAVMPRTAAKGKENGDNPENINLAALEDFMKTMQKAQSKGHIWRGRRTGLLIDDRKVTKNESGRDNIDSFWDNAYLDSDESSPPSGASSVVDSPASATEESWAGVVGDFEAAGGRGDDLDAEEMGNDSVADGEEDSGLAKRLEYRPPPKSPMRSEVSTDEELMAGGKAGLEGKRNDADDDDTETDGDQQLEQKQLEEQKHNELQEEKQLKEQQKENELEEEQQQLEEQLKQQELEEEQKQLEEQLKKKELEEEQKQLEEQLKQKELQDQKQKDLEEQQKQPADAADAAAGGEGGESTPKGTPKGYPGSSRSARGRGGSARGKGKGRGSVEADVSTPMSVSVRGEKDDVNLSEAVGTRSGGKGWRKQGHPDSSSDDDDNGGGWGGGDGGDWTFDDIREEEGGANDDGDGVPRAMSLSPRGGDEGSGGKESSRRRMSSRVSSRAKTPVRGDPPSSSRRSGVGDRTPVSPGGSGSSTRSSISRSSIKRSNTRKGLKTPRKTPASPASGGSRNRNSKGKGRAKDKDSDGGDSDDDDERKDDDVDDRDGEEALPSLPTDDDVDEAGVTSDTNTSPVTRGKSKTGKVGRERSPSLMPSAAVATPTAEVNESAGGKRKGKETRGGSMDKEVVVMRKGEKKGRKAGKAKAFASPGPPRLKDGPLFVDISEVSHVSETPGKRRSQRHRVAPLKFWKGDNIQYRLDEKGLPVAEGIVKGPSVIPTLSRKRVKDDSGQGAQRKRSRLSEAMTPLKPSQLTALPKGKYMEKEQECIVWDEYTAATKSMHMVMRSKNYVDHELPATLERPPGKEKVGRAAQAFYSPPEISPNYLTGRLVLPPGGIKDSEHVAYSNQVYVFTTGQPNALEFAIAMPSDKGYDANVFDPKTAQRFLLSPGDQFRVPMNNIYRLENHSEKCEAVIFWFIIKSAEA